MSEVQWDWNRYNLDKDLIELDDLIYLFFRETFPRIIWNARIYKDDKTDSYTIVLHLSYFKTPYKYIRPIIKYIKNNFGLEKDFVYEDEQACKVIQCKSVTKDKLLTIGGMCRILSN